MIPPKEVGGAPPSIVAQFSLMWSLECIRPFDVVVFSILHPLFAFSSGRNTGCCIVIVQYLHRVLEIPVLSLSACVFVAGVMEVIAACMFLPLFNFNICHRQPIPTATHSYLTFQPGLYSCCCICQMGNRSSMDLLSPLDQLSVDSMTTTITTQACTTAELPNLDTLGPFQVHVLFSDVS